MPGPSVYRSVLEVCRQVEKPCWLQGRRLAQPIGPGTVSIARHVVQMVLLILLPLPLAGMSTTTSLGIS